MAAYPTAPFLTDMRSVSPHPMASQQYSPSMGQGQSQVSPGSITYTTSTAPDGQIVYHCFKAVPVSYQTPQGIVSGIQWVPAEATQVLPAGAQPASAVPDFPAEWQTGFEDDRMYRDRQPGDEKRRKRAEKEAVKRMTQWERDAYERQKAEEHELRKAREKDQARARRKSFSVNPLSHSRGPSPVGGFGAPMPSAGYAGSGSSAGSGRHVRSASPVPGYSAGQSYTGGGYSTGGYGVGASAGGVNDLASSLANLDILDNPGRGSAYTDTSAQSRMRRSSMHDIGRKGTYTEGYSPNPNTGSGYGSAYKGAGTSPYAGSTAGTYGGSPYAAQYPLAGAGTTTAYQSQAPGVYPPSPSRPEANLPGAYPNPGYPPSPRPAYASANRPVDAYGRPSRPASPYVPPTSSMNPSAMRGGGGGGLGFSPNVGYSMDGQHGHRSRAPSPIPPVGTLGGMGYPEPNQAPLGIPEGFSRPPNLAQPYTPFETMKIEEMDELFNRIPRMPPILGPHDVYAEDWNRLLQDLTLAWMRKLPMQDSMRGSTKRASVVAEIIDSWNNAFFLPRGVEMTLYKGRERRSGPTAGLIDPNLSGFNLTDDDVSSASSASDSDSSSSLDESQYNAWGEHGGIYGRQIDQRYIEEQRRRKFERKVEKKVAKKRKEREKKLRRKIKEKEKKYAVYISSVEPRAPTSIGMTSTAGGY